MLSMVTGLSLFNELSQNLKFDVEGRKFPRAASPFEREFINCLFQTDCIMTKKEKKEEALRLKAEIEARKPKPEKTEIISKEQMERNNRQSYRKPAHDKDDPMYWQLKRKYRD